MNPLEISRSAIDNLLKYIILVAKPSNEDLVIEERDTVIREGDKALSILKDIPHFSWYPVRSIPAPENVRLLVTNGIDSHICTFDGSGFIPEIEPGTKASSRKYWLDGKYWAYLTDVNLRMRVSEDVEQLRFLIAKSMFPPNEDKRFSEYYALSPEDRRKVNEAVSVLFKHYGDHR